LPGLYHGEKPSFADLIHWFITVCESFLGASLWARANFDSDGEGRCQRASYGYQYLLNNFARPLVMTLGFFLASATVVVLDTFLFQYVGSAIAAAQSNTLIGLISIVAYVCIFGVMGIALFSNSFSIMTKLADTIIGFIGSSAHSAFSGDTESRANTRSAGSVGRGVQAGGKAAGRSGAPSGAATGSGKLPTPSFGAGPE
jgi:hypothetical protein